MGATLSNMGQSPLTGESVFDIGCAKDILSTMFTCGMYDYSGHWAYRLGIPRKVVSAGGLMAIVNRQLGLAVYSPPLDTRGNSRRGIDVWPPGWRLHAFDSINVGSRFLEVVL
jgi:glutaminase